VERAPFSSALLYSLILYAETIKYSKKMGADHTVDHRQDLLEQIQALGLKVHALLSLLANLLSCEGSELCLQHS